MNPLFIPAAFLLNRLPYSVKVMLMMSFSVVPACIFAWLALIGVDSVTLKNMLITLASIMLVIFVNVASAYYTSVKHALTCFHSALEQKHRQYQPTFT